MAVTDCPLYWVGKEASIRKGNRNLHGHIWRGLEPAAGGRYAGAPASSAATQYPRVPRVIFSTDRTWQPELGTTECELCGSKYLNVSKSQNIILGL